MVPELSRRIAVETAPAALALVCWGFLARLAPPGLSESLALIALVLALLYAVVRGRVLADSAPSRSIPADARALLVENLRAGLAAGVWLLAALSVYAIRGVWNALGAPGAFTDPSTWLANAFGGAALVAVVIYAVARWTAMEQAAQRPTSGSEPSADPSLSGTSSDD